MSLIKECDFCQEVIQHEAQEVVLLEGVDGERFSFSIPALELLDLSGDPTGEIAHICFDCLSGRISK